MKNIRILISILFICMAIFTFAQRGGNAKPHKNGRAHAHKGHQGKVVVVKRSPHRPHKIGAYHPHWRPHHTFHRRWVYFPGHNFYWDNWRNHYVFWNGVVWVSQPKAPPAIVNVNLEKEKHVELKEDEDDVDDVYKGNEDHKKEQKPE